MKGRCVVVAGAIAAFLLPACGGGGEAETGAGGKASKPAGGSAQKASQRQPAQDDARKAGPRKAWLTLNGYHGPVNVGILTAAERGYFDDVGIELTITSPVVPENPLGYVAEGSVELGISPEPQVVMEKEKGAPVVAVGSVLPRSTESMIWLEKSKIRDLADLKGKTIAIPGVPYQRAFLEILLAKAGLTLEDVKVKRVSFDLVPALVSGQADAIFGGTWNLEGTDLEARGLEPVVVRTRSLGIPDYDQLVLIARPAFVEKEPDLIRDFMSAVARGTIAAIEDPKAAVQLLEDS
jgi:putative hydroxymethylpyrimidine transport system substrate-binding protein